jgi:hypothetical protein
VSMRWASLIILAFTLTTNSGCSRGKSIERAVPSGVRSTLAPEQKTNTLPPEPEPAPGEPIRLKLPPDGGAWPWTVGQDAVESSEFHPISFPSLPPYAATGIAVRPEVNRAVVSLKWEKKGQPSTTRLALCDTAAGKILTEWQVPSYQAVIDLSPDGRAILTAFSQPGKERNTLRLWFIGSDGKLRKLAWVPHPPSRPDGILQDPSYRNDSSASQEIRWAGFVGNDRIVSFSRYGQLRVFDTDGANPLFSLEGSECRPALTPNGSKIAVLTGNAVTLVDPIAGAVIGTRSVGQVPQHPALAFSPDGSKLAIGGNGKALLLNLTSGDVQQVVLPKLHITDTGMFDKPFGWVGNQYLFADRQLYYLQRPMPVWEYTGIEQIQFRGKNTWACVRPAGSSTSTLAAYALPQLQPLMNLAVASQRPDLFVLKTGDGVRIDVEGLPEKKRAEAQTALEQRLRALGYQIDPAAKAVVFASVETVGTKTSIGYSGYETYSYMKKPAVLRLVLNGKELWSDAWAIDPPFSVRLPAAVSLNDHLKELPIGEPNYKLFASADFPSYFPNPQVPAVTLGTTELSGERLPGLW